jgi:type I restriction enzyme R subunit
MIKVKLSDQKVIELDSMVKTSFWSPDGKPVSSAEFVRKLFGDIPKFFKDEEELRRIWSMPDTRKKLIRDLSDNGYTESQLEDLQKIIHGEESDLYDVLSYIAWHRDMVPRIERADRARIYLSSYDPQQREFLYFVLDQYVRDGVTELDDQKLPDLLTLKYKAIADARKELGDIAGIRETFIGFQGYLYNK